MDAKERGSAPTHHITALCLVYNYYSESWTPPTSCPTSSQLPPTGSTDNGNVRGVWNDDMTVTSNCFRAAYSYDSVNRLTGAVATPCAWGDESYNFPYTYTADGSNGQYGNMSCVFNGQIAGCSNFSFSATTNQITSSGYTYDAAGNLTEDSSNTSPHTYQWDAEGRVSSVDSGSTWSLTYNALGDRVQWAYPGGADQHLFSPDGTWLGNAGEYTVFWFEGRFMAAYEGSETYFSHDNSIGSTSIMTNHAGNTVEDVLFTPWGDVLTATGTGGYSFAKMTYDDTKTNTDLTTARNYGPNFGRWFTPDPAGRDAADPGDPQTWNMYAYAGNNPTTNTDPTGELYCGPADENGTMPCVLDQEYFNNPDQYQGYTYYQSDYPQEQNEPKGQQEAGAQPPDLDPIDLGLLAYGGVNVVRGVVDAGASLINMVKGAFTSETPVIQTLGIASLWASADEVVNRAVATIGNQSMRVASKEVAEAAAEKFVGPGARTITDRSTGQVVGKISADGTKVYRTTRVGKAEPYINLENKSTGGNLHVRW